MVKGAIPAILEYQRVGRLYVRMVRMHNEFTVALEYNKFGSQLVLKLDS